MSKIENVKPVETRVSDESHPVRTFLDDLKNQPEATSDGIHAERATSDEAIITQSNQAGIG
ncbi:MULTISPECIES: hypothetical protein [Pectobacterium]|uniref:hypothetical protein n=1 Tax=Pectobacterium TaxID=122277 RepID=UPI0004E64798|nr:hypothetical protein [Pectobacterium brasiliense]KFF70081.1 hypothetical protein IW00_04745 [Pectobacterium brasiliense]